MAFLEVENLSFTYPECTEKALSGVSFSVNKGELCLVLGKSGSGKSTLLRLLKKEIAPCGTAEGRISIEAEKTGFVNQNIESNIVTDTVSGELAFALENKGESKERIALKLAETVSYFNFNSIFNEKTAGLSGGTKQLLSLAGAVIDNPQLLIFDEPVSQLDPVSAESFINMVKKLNKEQGITVLISNHNIQKLLSFADKIIYLDGGKASAFSSPREFADYLLNNDDEFKCALPEYTQAVKGAPISFAQAEKMEDGLNYMPVNSDNCFKEEKVLTAKNICFAYKMGRKDVLFSLNFNAYNGKMNCIVGSNGCGKTTLLKVLSGILKCYNGRVKAKGKICYMPQNVKAMFLKDTVFEELDGDDKLIESFGLEKLKSRNPFDLSGGEEQRLALAKIVKTGADIILLDEPSKSIDACFKIKLADMLKKLCRQGKTIILVTHDLEFAGRYADYVSFLFDGSITAAMERRKFFSSLDIYTTSLSRLTKGRAVSIDDIKV